MKHNAGFLLSVALLIHFHLGREAPFSFTEEKEPAETQCLSSPSFRRVRVSHPGYASKVMLVMAKSLLTSALCGLWAKCQEQDLDVSGLSWRLGSMKHTKDREGVPPCAMRHAHLIAMMHQGGDWPCLLVPLWRMPCLSHPLCSSSFRHSKGWESVTQITPARSCLLESGRGWEQNLPSSC